MEENRYTEVTDGVAANRAQYLDWITELVCDCSGEDPEAARMKVRGAAEVLGPNEDFDGLPTMLEDELDGLLPGDLTSAIG